MPPRTGKRGAAASGQKRTPRATRGTPKAQNNPPEKTAETAKVEEAPVVAAVEEKDDVKVEEVTVVEKEEIIEEETVLVDKACSESGEKSDVNGMLPLKSRFFFLLRFGSDGLRTCFFYLLVMMFNKLRKLFQACVFGVFLIMV